MTDPQVLYKLWPKQQFAFDLIFADGVEQPLYGGAAGGAKSHFARAVAAYLANLWPGSDVAIFRRTDSELQKNHVDEWEREVMPFVPGGRLFQQKLFFHWPSPDWCWDPKGQPCAHSSKTHFNHLDDNRGAKKHQGAEYAAELIDEATHFKGVDIDFLYTRVRAPKEKREAGEITGPDGKTYQYPGWPNYRRLQLLTANPGDIGHQYMLDNYIDPVSGLEFGSANELGNKKIVDGPYPLTNPDGLRRWMQSYERRDGTTEEIMVDVTDGQRWTVEIDLGSLGKVSVKRAFIPARLWDNPSLDPKEYAATIAVGSQEQKQRLLDGDWTFAPDRVFSQMSRDIHRVDAARIFGETRFGGTKPPPANYPRGIGHDLGTAKPTAAIWVTVEEEGFLVAYREYYQPGPIGQHVREIRRLMDEDGHPNLILQSDPRIFTKNQGVDRLINSQTIYRYAGEPPPDASDRASAAAQGIEIRASKITDVAALESLDDMLTPDADRLFPYWHPMAGQSGSPLLFIAEDCPNLWRELTNLQRPPDTDGSYAEGIKNGQPDHAFDALKRIADPLRKGAMIAERKRGQPRYILEAAG